MTARDIVKRARSLSDTPNSQFISYSDELESLWESYKDIYNKITDSSDDYYISEAILDTSTAVQLGDNEWELAVPADLFKIRFVDYMWNGRWTNMSKFNTNNRNKVMSNPQYRWRGSKLWIVSSSLIGLPSQIRIDYYPPPVKPSLPEADYQYALSYSIYDAQKITSPNYFSVRNANLSDVTDYLIYVYNSVDIRVESTTFNKTNTLYTSTGLSNVLYNLGYIYFLKGGDIWRASTNLTSTITPVAITSLGTVTAYNISNGKIYFSTSTETKSCDLDGTNISAALYAYETKNVSVIGTDVYFIKTSDNTVYKNGVSVGLIAQYLSGDGYFLYYLDSASVLHKYMGTYDVILGTNATYMGVPQDNFIAVVNDQYEVSAISVLEDTDFAYPLNEANEIMAYQSAIDYKRKQKGDTAELTARLAAIWDRFFTVLRRDEGQPERRSPEAPYWNY
jgi:hypothetical protein